MIIPSNHEMKTIVWKNAYVAKIEKSSYIYCGRFRFIDRCTHHHRIRYHAVIIFRFNKYKKKTNRSLFCSKLIYWNWTQLNSPSRQFIIIMKHIYKSRRNICVFSSTKSWSSSSCWVRPCVHVIRCESRSDLAVLLKFMTLLLQECVVVAAAAAVARMQSILLAHSRYSFNNV